MSLRVLDASAVLAYLWKERGWEKVESILLSEQSFISTVNLSEVACKALERGFSEEEALRLIDHLDIEPVVFDADQAWKAAVLRKTTRALGLSLGDRACLALAQSRRCSAVTADKAWTDLDLGIEIVCIR